MKKILISLLVIYSHQLSAQSPEYAENKAKKLAKESPFTKIINRELPATIVYEDDEIIAFVPLRKQAPVHYLIVPKKRILTINNLQEEDVKVIGQMHLVAKRLALKEGISETGYRLSINTNEDSGQSVFHLHMHLLGGMKLGPMVEQTYREERE
ncbi:histidine triad (HIT) family protein [Reichenbachiella faecimaris]|uniref:Histidine triad (HIT) family protein n=1 Tax=Reichenbachiella faecimaris TaxID=692418 RepID=A0A1W2GF02_REIFA|nr:histidine triad nucleotide-binding protein [Reichenbachiella faecimaris]SMD35225.1 histidine triad (HIT) family protein [Reichenbachiella faecimaris]